MVDAGFLTKLRLMKSFNQLAQTQKLFVKSDHSVIINVPEIVHFYSISKTILSAFNSNYINHFQFPGVHYWLGQTSEPSSL